jgi:coenzyme F420 hydrogenase subunit beta
MEDTGRGPLPVLAEGGAIHLDPAAYNACPGKGANYPALYSFVFASQPQNWLAGPYRRTYVGFSNDPDIRRHAASGGVITQTLAFLLDQGFVDGAVVLRQGCPKPWLAQPMIARNKKQVLASSQSVYVPSPVNVILEEMEAFDGRLAYVGLPDQVASLRSLQQAGHPGALKVEYILGPYVGTAFYLGAIQSYLHANGVDGLEQVSELRYREGEWPGYLHIRTLSGKVLRASKFYYNYLIPFYITRSSLLSVDFTNELTDISVGDAWNPRYESLGGGYSVVMARSAKGENLLRSMRERGLLTLEEISIEEALSMHGHMLDFKKRGAFIRIAWLKRLGRPVPDYGYLPEHLPFSRKLVEAGVSAIFLVCQTAFARRMVEILPLKLVGPLFDVMRRIWKRVSKPTKRRGLGQTTFRATG